MPPILHPNHLLPWTTRASVVSVSPPQGGEGLIAPVFFFIFYLPRISGRRCSSELEFFLSTWKTLRSICSTIKKNSYITAITPNHLGGTSTSYQVSSRLDLRGETASRNKQLISTKGTFGTLKITEFPKLQYLTNQRCVTAGWTTLTYKYKKSKVPPNLKRLQVNTRP